MNNELIEFIINNKPDLELDRVENGVAYRVDGSEITEATLKAVEDEYKVYIAEKKIKDTVATVEAIYNKQVTALFKRASALPEQPVRRITAEGQSTQNLVYQTFQTAESLGLVKVLTEEQKLAIKKILPWLELASKTCDKLTADVLAGKDVADKIKLASELKLSKPELTAEKLEELKTAFEV